MGLHLIEGAKGLNCRFAQMVDLTARPEFDDNVAAAQKIVPTEYNMFAADFREPSIFESLDSVDV